MKSPWKEIKLKCFHIFSGVLKWCVMMFPLSVEDSTGLNLQLNDHFFCICRWVICYDPCPNRNSIREFTVLTELFLIYFLLMPLSEPTLKFTSFSVIHSVQYFPDPLIQIIRNSTKSGFCNSTLLLQYLTVYSCFYGTFHICTLSDPTISHHLAN